MDKKTSEVITIFTQLFVTQTTASITYPITQQYASKFSGFHKAFNAAGKESPARFSNRRKCLKSASSTGGRSIAAKLSGRSSAGSQNGPL